MTTINKDITNFLEEQGIGYNPIRMLNLLGKLDHEDLEDLLFVLEELGENSESYDSGYAAGKSDAYDKGYADGYDDGCESE